MKYVVTSVWKHPDTIDWQQMRQNMSEAKDNPNIAEIHWDRIFGLSVEIYTFGPLSAIVGHPQFATSLGHQKAGAHAKI